MSSESKFKTLIIIDLETTGLVYDQPKITELAMIAVNVATLEEMKAEEELPRILNKFVKFFDPVKLLRAEVAELTGLTNRMLMDYAPFNRETVLAMESFLSDFQKPFCFVAHNGNLFDFPILYKEIQSALSTPPYSTNHEDKCIDQINTCDTTPTKDSSVQTTNDYYNQTSLFNIDCADSLVFFREIHRLLNDKDIVQYPTENTPSEPLKISNENNSNTTNNNQSVDSVETTRLGYVEIPIKYTPSLDPARQQLSMRLVKIYEREFSGKSSQLKSHQAEDDCLMLLALIKRYLPDWLEWIEPNHQTLKNFSSLPLSTTKKTPAKPLVTTKRPLKF